MAEPLELDVARPRRHPLRAAAGRPGGPRCPTRSWSATVTSSRVLEYVGAHLRVRRLVAGRLEPVDDRAPSPRRRERRSGRATVVRSSAAPRPRRSEQKREQRAQAQRPAVRVDPPRAERRPPQPGRRDRADRRGAAAPWRARARPRRRASCRPGGGARSRAPRRGRRPRAPRLAGLGGIPCGSTGESPKPGRSTAITSRSAASRSMTGSQIRRDPPRPWIRTRGSPLPARV